MNISALEKASQRDRDEIVRLIQRVVETLNKTGIPQWDEVYPTASDVEEDLEKQELYVARAEGRIAGIITLNRSFDPAYQNGDWQYNGSDFMVVHRLCVSPDMQDHGVGKRMMRMAEAMLRENGIQSVRLDAFSKNPYSLRLYDKLGYRVTGEAQWRMGLFYLMEKNITACSGADEK